MGATAKTFDDYDLKAASTDRYDLALPSLVYMALGLSGETGELVDKVKKVFRDDDGELSPATHRALALELGDVLWYMSRMAACLGYSLQEIAEMNINKLADRASRGKLGGSGDER